MKVAKGSFSLGIHKIRICNSGLLKQESVCLPMETVGICRKRINVGGNDGPFRSLALTWEAKCAVKAQCFATFISEEVVVIHESIPNSNTIPRRSGPLLHHPVGVRHRPRGFTVHHAEIVGAFRCHDDVGHHPKLEWFGATSKPCYHKSVHHSHMYPAMRGLGRKAREQNPICQPKSSLPTLSSG